MPADPGGASVAPHPGRTTLLMYACSQGDLKQVQRILHDQPSTLHHLDRTLRTPLHYCAGGASTIPSPAVVHPAASLSHCADVLIMAAPDLVHSRDQDGFTPLHLAVIAGNVQLVQFLLANGADVKAKDGEKHSVVHWATVCGETAALQAVLAAGAEVSTPDVHGGYPLHYAAQMCGSEKPDLGLQVLHILLSSPGVPVSVTDNDGRQPLLWAASAGSARAVLALVRAGSAVEASDRDGLTALHCAASRGHTDTLDTLLTLCGAQTDIIDSNGCTALHYSVTLGHADATALLLSHSADPNLQDRKGRSPAHCGCAKGQLETVRQLHASNANLWLRTARGDLPLHEAAASGRRQLVRWLLDQRPSQVNSRNNDGRGLLHLAALNDNADMCKILLDSGAVVNPLLRTSKNVFMTPLDCALQRGFRSTAKFLQLHGGVPANRLNTLRLSSEVATNVTSGSHLHIRDDITIFGDSSSETELKDTHKSKDHRGRRKTVRRKLSYRHERRRSYSGSEQEVDSKARAKSSIKSAHEKAGKKYESERRAKSRDDVNKIKDRDHKSKYRKKKQEIESEDSVSETESSPDIKKDKDRRKIISEVERQRNGAISNVESSKKTIPSDHDRKKSKKHHQDDSSNELSDREKRKSKKHAKEELYDKKARKSHSSNGDQENLNHVPAEQEEHSSEVKSKNKSVNIEDIKQRKSRKSDISDSDTHKNISDTERKKIKSADKKAQKEKSIEENLSEKEMQEVKKEKLKQKSASKSKSSEEELDSENSQNKKEVIQKEEIKTTASEVDEKLQNQDDTTSTQPASVLKTELSKTESKIASSTENTSTETTKEATITHQEPSDTKHLEEDAEQPLETLQLDQISLQSKLSEESPSKTIVVEAAVHHPPKGMSTEDNHEKPKAIVKDEVNAEKVLTAEEVLTAEVDTAQEAKIEAEDKQTIQSEPEKDNTEVKPEEADKTDEQTVVFPESIEKEETVVNKDASVSNKEETVTNKEATLTNEEANAQVEVRTQEDAALEDKEVASETQEVDASVTVEEKDKINAETIISDSTEIKQNYAKEMKEDENTNTAEINAVENGVTEESSTLETKETTETAEPQTTTETVEQQTTTETEGQKMEDTESKKELNIDLSLKKFEESAELQNEVTDVDDNENLKEETMHKENETIDESKQKKYRKKVRISKHKDKKDVKDGTEQPEDEEESSSTSRETSSSDSESEKSVKKSKISDSKNSEHKSFKILKDDVAFEILKDSPVKESRRHRKTSKKRQKESQRVNESATSSPEMLESVRTRSKSVPRQKDPNQSVTLPSLVEKRPESNLSAPNLSSVYSDNEQKSGSNSEADDLMSSASRKKRLKRRSKLRVGSKSAGSDYESSNLIDSGFEPSPRSSRIPKRKVMSERGVNMTSVTQQIQSNIRKYHMERKIFQHLLDLKRLQIRSGQANESVLVKRAIDTYHNSVAASVGAGRYVKKDYTYRSFEQFLYQSLRMLQKSPVDHMKGLPETTDNPLLCTQSTHKCLHATHAYTGIPCAAYLPKMNHHTMPKIGFTPRSSSSFLPQINSKGKSVTLELCHGNDKQVISLPADRLDHNKRYYVTFTVKGQEGQSPVDQENTTSHRHAKSV